MAEAVGLAIGAVSLAGLFTTCVECLDYISLGRDYSRDYEISITKLVLLKARLRAWGRPLQVTQVGQENPALRDCWVKERDTVGRCLIGIKTMFEDARQIESRYGLKASPIDSGALSILQEHTSGAFRQIESAFKSEMEKRQDQASLFEKTRWAVRDKKKFDSLIADLAFFVGGLEELSNRLQVLGLQQRLLQREVQEITDTDSINMMEKASNQIQAMAVSQISKEENLGKDAYGHTYIGTIIKDRAKVLNGNIGYQSQISHLYRDTQVSDDAHVVQGDMSNEAALAFFK